MDKVSANTPGLQEQNRISDRLTFLYVERCVINRAENAITITDTRGTVNVPVTLLSVLLLGPGTKVTHRAVELAADCGVMFIWVGEQGVRYYAHGKPLSASSKLIQRQAALVSNVKSRAAVCRKMYQMRFKEDVSGKTIQELRGLEGTRIARVYYEQAKMTGVPWNYRTYNLDDFTANDSINQALTAAHQCLYGICHSAIVALGLSPALGFVHTGHENSFVYDIADLYKHTITIPIAFDMVASGVGDIPGAVRRETRDVFKKTKLLKQIIKDLHSIIQIEGEDAPEVDILNLWDDKLGEVDGNKNYGSKLADAIEAEEDDPDDEGSGETEAVWSY
ncbi:MAG: type I-E CRISPR-associated endonuclease Cas1e [Oscillospiraceae bacterium]|jgi:CRISPR-associated protein Cas1|nr:type I-E CRISPR-associated endonuclease Cas1e [Oscillospiraceae bacterium]